MVFYLECRDLPEQKCLRLQNDLSWRACGIEEPLSKDDYCSIKPHDISTAMHNDRRAKNANMDIFDQVFEGHKTDRDFFCFPLVKRVMFPKIPSKAQLVSVIDQGDDRQTNSLLLNVFGFFEIRETYSVDYHDPSMVLRFETSSAGNGYVGELASNCEDEIERHYAYALYYWYRHLKTGKTNYYTDYSGETEDEPNILESITKMEKKFEELLAEMQENYRNFNFYSFIPYEPEYASVLR